MIYQGTITTPIGFMGIRLIEEKVVGLDFLEKKNDQHLMPEGSLVADVIEQLIAYFQKPISQFHLPLKLMGTDFQKRVWEALLRIPPCTTVTYGDLAKKLCSSPRAIGNACRKNPIPIIVPCHRVVGAKDMGGYCGNNSMMLEKKSWLLSHEHKYVQ